MKKILIRIILMLSIFSFLFLITDKKHVVHASDNVDSTEQINANLVPLSVGMNLRGKTIYFRTDEQFSSMFGANLYFNSIDSDIYLSKDGSYGGCFVFHNTSSEIIFWDSDTQEWLMDSFTFPDDKDYIIVYVLDCDMFLQSAFYYIRVDYDVSYLKSNDYSNIDVGMNLKGKTIYFDTSYYASVSSFIQFSNDDEIGYESGDFYFTNGGDGVYFALVDNNFFNYFSYTFPDDQDYIISKIDGDFSFIYVQLSKYHVVDVSLNELYHGYYFNELEYNTVFEETKDYVETKTALAIMTKNYYDDGVKYSGYDYKYQTTIVSDEYYQSTDELYVIFLDLENVKDEQLYNIYFEVDDGILLFTSGVPLGTSIPFEYGDFYLFGKSVLDFTAYQYNPSSGEIGQVYSEEFSCQKGVLDCYVDLILFSDVVFTDWNLLEDYDQTFIWEYNEQELGRYHYGYEIGLEEYYEDNVVSNNLALTGYCVSMPGIDNTAFIGIEELWDYIFYNCMFSSEVIIQPVFAEKVLQYESAVIPLEGGIASQVFFSEFTSFSVPGYEYPNPYFIVTGYYYDSDFSKLIIDETSFLLTWKASTNYITNVYIDAYITPIDVIYSYELDNGIITGSKKVSYEFLDPEYTIRWDTIWEELKISAAYSQLVSLDFNGQPIKIGDSIVLSRTEPNYINLSLYSNVYSKLANVVFRDKTGYIITATSNKFDVLINEFIHEYVSIDFPCSLYTTKYLVDDITVTNFNQVYDYYMSKDQPSYSYVIEIMVISSHEEYYYGPTVIYKKTSAILLESEIQNMLKKYITKCIHTVDYSFEDINYIGNGNKLGNYQYMIIFHDGTIDVKYIINITVITNLHSDYVFGNMISYSLDNLLTTSQIVSDLKKVSYFPNVSMKTSFYPSTSMDEKFLSGEVVEEGIYSFLVEYETTSGLSESTTIDLNVTAASSHTTDDDIDTNCTNISDEMLADILAVIFVAGIVTIIIALVKKKK